MNLGQDRTDRSQIRTLPARIGWFLAALLCCHLLSGCAALTNPVANGIPVRRLAPEYLAPAREEEEPIPLSMLRQKPPEHYLLSSGDILGLWIEGVLGERNAPVPVQMPDQATKLPPAVGYPVPVREDGTIALPLVDPIKVKGMTLVEAEQAIRKAYTNVQEILKPGRDRIYISLLRPRLYHVLVIREDSGGLTIGSEGIIGNTKRGTGSAIELPAYENDVLNALARTGGLPGLDAANEVVIQRGYFKPGQDLQNVCQYLGKNGSRFDGIDTVRIPLRLRPGEQPPIKPDDIILRDGDILYIRARDTELFYTGGLLPPGEQVLPRDYDLDVVEAVMRVGGPLISGGVQGSNLNGTLIGGGIGFPSPSQLTVVRKVACGGQIAIEVDLNRAFCDARERIIVMPGDILILQEKPTEAFARYMSIVFKTNLFGRFINQEDFQGSSTVVVP